MWKEVLQRHEEVSLLLHDVNDVDFLLEPAPCLLNQLVFATSTAHSPLSTKNAELVRGELD